MNNGLITKLLYIFKLFLSKIQCQFLKRIIWWEVRYFSINGFSEWKKKKSWLRPNYYHFWKIIWITLLLEFNCSRTQEVRLCKCKWFYAWGKSKALVLWMKMLQNVTQLSYYYLPHSSKDNGVYEVWNFFFRRSFIISDQIHGNEKRLQLQCFLSKYFSCHFFFFHF